MTRCLSCIALCVILAALAGCQGALSRGAAYVKRGQQYMEEGQFAKARIEFRNALQLTPASADVRFYNGVVAERLGNLQEAAAFYENAIDANKDHVGARANFGRILVEAGFPDRALEIVNPSLSAHPNEASLMVVHAMAMQQKKNPTAALAEALRALQLDPRSEEAVAAVAGIEMKNGQGDEAQRLLEDAVKRLPKSIELRHVLVELYLERENLAAAQGTLTDLIRARPRETVYRVQLAQLQVRDNHVDEAERILRAALAEQPEDSAVKSGLLGFLWARRGHEVAEHEAKEMLAANPSDSEVHLTLAALYEQGGDTARAEAEYRAVIASERLDVNGVLARDRLAAILQTRNDAPGAQRLISEVLEHNPADNQALALRAHQALVHGDSEAAITDLRRILKDQPNSVPLLAVLASAYLAGDEPELAEDAARHAVELDPSNVASRIELARILLVDRKLDESRVILDELRRQRPEDTTVLDLSYRVSLAQKDLEPAGAIADELVRLRPDWALGPLYQGLVAEQRGHGELAYGHYRHALELQPTAVEPLTAMVRLLKAARRFDDAVRVLDDISQRYPKAAIAPELKGEVLLAQGAHLPQAEAAFRVAQQRAPAWWNAYRGMAYLEMFRHNFDAAERVLNDARQRAVLGEPQRLEMAVQLTALGRSEEAIRQYEEILKARPKSPNASAGLAMLLVSFHTDPASRHRAAGLVAPFAASTDWRMLDAFGWVQYKNDELGAALPALERAAAQQPGIGQVRFHLGMAELKAGKRDMAEKNLAAACNDERFFGYDEARAILAHLHSTGS